MKAPFKMFHFRDITTERLSGLMKHFAIMYFTSHIGHNFSFIWNACFNEGHKHIKHTITKRVRGKPSMYKAIFQCKVTILSFHQTTDSIINNRNCPLLYDWCTSCHKRIYDGCTRCHKRLYDGCTRCHKRLYDWCTSCHKRPYLDKTIFTRLFKALVRAMKQIRK